MSKATRVDRGTVLLSGIVGSTAYGLANESSDVDRLGVYTADTSDYLGLHPPPDKAQSTVLHEPDVTYHEALKYCRLSLSCNPTTTELMWLPDNLRETKTPLGNRLITLRSYFLSETAVKNAYYGYCNQQLKRMIARRDRTLDPDDGVPERFTKIAKHARHLMRLKEQLESLWRYGTIPIRVKDREAIFDFGDRVANGDMERARRMLDSLQYMVDETPSVLPSAPNEKPIEDWLQDVRRAHWTLPNGGLSEH